MLSAIFRSNENTYNPFNMLTLYYAFYIIVISWLRGILLIYQQNPSQPWYQLIYHSHAACLIYKAHFTSMMVYNVTATITS